MWFGVWVFLGFCFTLGLCLDSSVQQISSKHEEYQGFIWFCLVLFGFVWFCLVLFGFVWFC